MKWYQEAIINGVKMPTQRKHDTNEKRWKNYIRSFVPPTQNGDKFVELGSNAGFYLRKVAELGYRVLGVEISSEYCDQANYWEKNDPRGVVTIHGDMNDFNLFATKFVLLANVHYWLTQVQLNLLVDKLKKYAMNVIVVGRFKKHPTHKSDCSLKTLEKTFNGWNGSKIKAGFKYYSVLLSNPLLREYSVDSLFKKQPLARSKYFLPTFTDFINKVLSGEPFNPMETDYYRYIKKQTGHTDKDFFDKKIQLIKEIKEEGVKEPLVVGRFIGNTFVKDRLTDGDHRLIIAKYLKFQTVICRLLRN